MIVTILFLLPLFKLKAITNSVINFTSKYQFEQNRYFKTGIITLIILSVFKLTKLIDHNLPYLVSRSIILNYKDAQYIDNFNAKIDSKNKFS